MALLADEELQGIVPRQVETVKKAWVDIGYYTDTNGNRRYGRLPKYNNQIKATINLEEYYDANRIRSSNPQVSNGYL